MAIREKAFRPDHPDVANSLRNLAGLYDAQEKYTDAELLYKRTVRIAEASLGPDHPDTRLCRKNLKLYQAHEGILIFGCGFIAMGIISMLLGHMIQGTIFTAIGLLTFFTQRPGMRPYMFILMGIFLLLDGILNIFGGEFGGRTVLGVLLLLAGIYASSRFWKYTFAHL